MTNNVNIASCHNLSKNTKTINNNTQVMISVCVLYSSREGESEKNSQVILPIFIQCESLKNVSSA